MKGKMLSFFRIAMMLFVVTHVSCKSSIFLKKNQKKIIETALQEARSYYGIPYKYGENTRVGIDCSALIQNSFKAAGVNFPRSTKNQIKMGKEIPLRKIKKGDLVFFKPDKKAKKVSHVGLVSRVVSKKKVYFIHASTSRGVIEDHLITQYWKKLILSIRRIF